MSVSLWESLDTTLEATALAALGSAGSYTTLVVRRVIVGESVDVDKETLPVVLVRGISGRGEFVGHDHLAAYSYPYILAGYVEGTGATAEAAYRAAKRNAQEMLVRLRGVVKGAGLYDAAGADGERPTRVSLDREYLELRGPVSGKVLGIAVVTFTVESEVQG